MNLKTLNRLFCLLFLCLRGQRPRSGGGKRGEMEKMGDVGKRGGRGESGPAVGQR